MEEDEVAVLFITLGLAAFSLVATHTTRLSALAFRGNPWPGVVRLGIAGAFAWIAGVLAFFADPSVVGVYVVFYLALGACMVQLFGVVGSRLFGVRYRVDVVERRNPAAALFIACFVLATGFLFGGSLWGEADPTGDDDGGWWIPLGFFGAGWVSLVLLLALFWWRENTGSRRALISDRNRWAARAAGVYALSVGWVLTHAVAGDFYGWIHGLSAVLAVLVMVVAHEAFRMVARWLGGWTRILEMLTYALAALVIPTLGRVIERPKVIFELFERVRSLL